MARVIISAPPEEDARTVQRVEAGQDLAFDFSFDGASVTRDGSSLSIAFEKGGELVLEDFFVAGDAQTLPALELSDGTIIAAADFLQSMNPDLDVSLAAGPQASSATGSGAGTYTDDGGALLDGVNRMGMLDSLAMSGSAARQGVTIADSLPGLAAPDAPAGPGGPAGPGPTGPALSAYAARAVLYVGDEDYAGGYAVLAQALYPDASGTPVPVPGGGGHQVAIAPTGEWNRNWGDWSYDPSTGRIAVSLTEAGHAALFAPDVGNLLEYFTVSVTGPGGGAYAYIMQVVVTADREFSSPGQNAAPGGIPLAGEDVLHGEWHSAYGGGNDDGAYRIVSSTGHDEIIIRDAFQNGSEIYASRQENAAYDPADPSTFTGGDDANTISLLGGMRAENGAANLVDSSNGSILAEQRGLGGDASAMHADGGSNRINGHAGAASVRAVAADGVAYAMQAKADDGENHIRASGTVDIAAYGAKQSYAMHAASAGVNTVTGGPGTVTVTAGNLDASARDENGFLLPLSTGEAAAMYADSGRNSISASGAVEIAAFNALTDGRIQDAYAMYAKNNGSNTVTDAASVSANVAGSGNNSLYAMYVGTGQNSISASDSALLSVSGAYNGSGMHTGGQGVNSVTQTGGAPGAAPFGVNIEVSARSDAYGMHAMGYGGRNAVTALDDVDLSVYGGRLSFGMHSEGSGRANTVTSRSGSVTVTAGNLDEAATDANGNSIPVATDQAAAMYASYGMNHIAAAGEVELKAASTLDNGTTGTAQTERSASGMFAFNGTNSIGAPLDEDGPLPAKVSVSARASSDASWGLLANGLYAYAGGSNSIDSGGTVDISASVAHQGSPVRVADHAYGMRAGYSSSMATYLKYGAANAITAKSDVTVEASASRGATSTGTSYAYGISTGAHNSLSGEPAQGRNLLANTIRTDGDVSITATADGNDRATGSATGIITYDSHIRSLDVRTAIESKGEVWITASASGTYASSALAVRTSGPKSETLINAAKDVHLLATMAGPEEGTPSGYINGSYAQGLVGGGTTIVSEEGDITITAAASGHAMLEAASAASGTNTLTASSGQISIQAYGQGDTGTNAYTKGVVVGLRSYDRGTNLITAESVHVTAGNLNETEIKDKNGAILLTAGKTLADACAVWESGAGNEIRAGAGGVTLAAATTLGTASGLRSEYNANSIATSGALDISAQGGKAAYGMETFSYGTNSIEGASAVTVTAGASIGDAYGMYAFLGGTNSVKGTDAVAVTADALGKAYAMHALGYQGAPWAQPANSIDLSGADRPVTVILTAASGSGAAEAFAMYAALNGINSIATGSGGDKVTLTGNIYAATGGRNSIHTGAGDDTVTLNGKVEVTSGRSFTINGGDGYDLLVLEAANAGEFAGRYGIWLQTLSPGDLAGIEAVRFVNVTPQDVGQGGSLQAVYDSLTNAGISVIVGEMQDAAGILNGGTAVDYASYEGVFDSADVLGGDTVSFGDGADRLAFSNGLSGGGINMGAGNDMLSVDGERLENTRIDMGDGRDHLSLGGGMHLENAAIDMGDGDDHVYLGPGVSFGSGVTINGGGGMDALHLGEAGTTLSLADFAGILDGFEVLDLSGGGDTTLRIADADIDALLAQVSADGTLDAGLLGSGGTFTGDLTGVSVVRITGDQSDAVRIDETSGYSGKGTVAYDGVFYTVYQADSDAQALLIQTELLGGM